MKITRRNLQVHVSFFFTYNANDRDSIVILRRRSNIKKREEKNTKLFFLE